MDGIGAGISKTISNAMSNVLTKLIQIHTNTWQLSLELDVSHIIGGRLTVGSVVLFGEVHYVISVARELEIVKSEMINVC